ncbi:flagellar basal body-associated FliL family protein [Phaeovibrio sulfidiphilus]|uniref:Flagellar protein FliL n=1 Tax=Phaeovibrio sulfidiphilus TaxID=1220600 RepID=A0A8J6Z0X6_9PROT|nr:flagellar basal body-associated FliL family protein [Phaeovibrio sulfidiphilus]MBE1237778.1 flagellar basal body-associated FliL family protein [Phaeovibrio sulfidiphilus]
MADEELDDAGAGAPPSAPSGKKKKLLIIILLAVLLLAGIGAGAYFSGLLGSTSAETAASGDGAGAAPATAPPGETPPFYVDLEQITVDLNSGTPRRRPYLQVRLTLVVDNYADIEPIRKAVPEIMDSFRTYLRELRLEDLQGSAGVHRLREELLYRVNRQAAPAKAQNVLFKDILIQ